jgi:hypothetical protein
MDISGKFFSQTESILGRLVLKTAKKRRLASSKNEKFELKR